MNDLELVGQGVLSLEAHKAEKTALTEYAKKTDIPASPDLSGYAKLTDVRLEAQTRTAIQALIK